LLDALIELRDLGAQARGFRGTVLRARNSLRERVFLCAQAFDVRECSPPLGIESEDAIDERRVALPCRRSADTFGIATD
jgi:hypothetical protein